ncbi:MAG: 3-phosphoshikimate 1-carboxyvinyltransferase [Candidatus Helarchaeota archaeon]|nr:3-phosphoshikimate 1-carboxyvinyltransferase [Candidatus Helarchaeota archaeon]
MNVKLKKLEIIDTELTAPPSKSLTHRAIFIASLANGTSKLKNYLISDDTNYSIKACSAFGPKIENIKGDLHITGMDYPLKNPLNEIYVGNSGTTMRFITSYSALMKNNQVKIYGNKRMNERPIGDLIHALNDLGVKTYSINKNNCPPIIVEGGGIRGGRTTLKGDISSQFFSSLLISCVKAENDVEIHTLGALKSRPYIDLTIDTIRYFEGEIKNENYKKFTIPANQQYIPKEFIIEGDFSSASYFLGIAAVLGGKIRINNLNFSSSQGDKIFLDILKKMGCKIKYGKNWIEVEGTDLHGITIDMKDYPDLVPTLAVVGAYAKGETYIQNVEHLKYKETDRIKALATELKKIGSQIEELPTGLIIKKGKTRAAEINTYDDHRIAMSFAIAALKTGKIVIKDIECVSKSFPNFFNLVENIIESQN